MTTSHDAYSQTWATRPTPTFVHHSSYVTSTATARPPTRPNNRSTRSITVENEVVVSRTTAFKWARGELIGKGSYGRVFLALNANTAQVMAVKQVEKPRTDLVDKRQREVVEALIFESKTFQDLGEHPNIVQYLGFEETPESLNIFLEYIPGGTIASCLSKHGRFDQDVTKWFTGQIAAGLEFLHSKRVLHRDLKGENILVELSGVCKISDFGISKMVDKDEAFTAMRGTVYWMAPEVVDNSAKRGYDSKVDIWSLGCVVLEMWTGKRPWIGEEVISVMLKLYRDKLPPPIPPDILAGLSESALDFRRECFAMNPQERPTAGFLRKHPYLKLPPDWVFQLSDLERLPRQSTSRRKSRLSARQRSAPAPRHRRVASNAAPPVPLNVASTVPLNAASPVTCNAPPVPPKPTDTIRPSEHSQPSINTSPLNVPGPSKLRSAEPPPLVYIAPPSSPRISSRASSSSATSESTRTSPQPRKSFHVTNPDLAPEEERARRHRTPFQFTPPPLPETPRLVHSQRSQRRTGLQVDERRLAPAVSMQNMADRVATTSYNQSPVRRDDEYSDSDSDSYGGTFWKKPPMDHQKSPSVGEANKYVHRRSIIETKRDTTWAPRPGVHDVYDNLEDFFPWVDLDRPIDAVASIAAGVSDRQRRTKSIRMQVAEVNRLSVHNPGLQRATTKLWGHKVEEVTRI